MQLPATVSLVLCYFLRDTSCRRSYQRAAVLMQPTLESRDHDAQHTLPAGPILRFFLFAEKHFVLRPRSYRSRRSAPRHGPSPPSTTASRSINYHLTSVPCGMLLVLSGLTAGLPALQHRLRTRLTEAISSSPRCKCVSARPIPSDFDHVEILPSWNSPPIRATHGPLPRETGLQ